MHLRNIVLPVLGVFGVLIGLGLAIYCAHMLKVKFARAVTNEQYLSNYNYSEMTAVTNNKAKATSTAIIIDRRDPAKPTGKADYEELGFSWFPAQNGGTEEGVKGEGGSSIV